MKRTVKKCSDKTKKILKDEKNKIMKDTLEQMKVLKESLKVKQVA